MAARCIERGGMSSCTIKRKIPVLCTPALFFLGIVLYVSELPYSMQIRREASMAFRLGIIICIYIVSSPCGGEL
jgi:hypothetical protein